MSKRTLLALAPAMVGLLGALALAAPSAASAATAKPAVTAPAEHGTLKPVHTELPGVSRANGVRGGAVTSGNWSGYADVACSTCSIRYVNANFTVPSLNCTATTNGTSGDNYAAFWDGLDGYSDNTVEQTGVDASCVSASSGAAPTAEYVAWYEMYPQDPVEFTTQTISAGDAINVSVYYNSSAKEYSLYLKDITTGVVSDVEESCPSGSSCKNSSAEVITEDPGDSAPDIDLSDFGQANFEGISVTSLDGTHGDLANNNIWTTNSITMVDGSSTMASVSPTYGGQAFSVNYVDGS